MQLEQRLLLSADQPPAALDDLVAVPISSLNNAILPLTNDWSASNEALALKSISVAGHGTASIHSNGRELLYSPHPDFTGVDEITYVVTDQSGGTATAKIRIHVGVASQAIEELTALAPTSEPSVSAAWIAELKSGIGDIVIPQGGVTIDEPIVIDRPRRIIGNGQTMKFVGHGQLIVRLASTSETFELRDARVLWERDPSTVGADTVFAISSGSASFSANQFLTAITTAGGQQDIADLQSSEPEAYLIRTILPPDATESSEGSGGESSPPAPETNIRIDGNSFANIYWYEAGVFEAEEGTRPSVEVTDNSIKFFHSPFIVRNSASAIFAENTFEQNTGPIILIEDSTNLTVRRNQFRYSGGLSTDASIQLVDTDNASIVENTFLNGAGSAIRILGVSNDIHISSSFIHSYGEDGIAIGNGSPGESFERIHLFNNMLAQNGGWGLSAHHVNLLVLEENVFHQNRIEDGFQHSFESVSGITDVRNLWDTDYPIWEEHIAAFFGTNVRTYSFSTGMVTTESETLVTPLDTASLGILEPTGNADAYEAWLTELETGTGDITIPEHGIVISRPVMIRNPRRILGDGRTLKLSGNGTITVSMHSADSDFEIHNAVIIWDRDIGQYGAANAITVLKGGLNFSDNRLYSLITPPSHFYDSPFVGHTMTHLTLVQSAASSYVFNVQTGQAASRLVFERNTFENSRWYTVGLFYSQDNVKFTSASVRDNTIKYFHGALYLSGINDGIVEGNRLHRNSFGNLVIRNSTNATVRYNRLEFPGNGTSGDGATIWGVSNLTFEHNLITNGSCYGIWLLDNVSDSRFSGNVIHAGITSGLRADSRIGEGAMARLEIVDNLFSHNKSWGVSGSYAEFVTIERNTFQSNYKDPAGLQHSFRNFQRVVANDNHRGSEAGSRDTNSFGVSLDPYWILSEGHDLTVEGNHWTFHGTAGADSFEVLVDDNLHVRMNGDWRTIDLDEFLEVSLKAGNGSDLTLFRTTPGLELATLKPGHATIEGSQFRITTDTEKNSVYGHKDAVVLTFDSSGNDQLYVSPNYIRSSGTGFGNYAQGFGGTLNYSTGGNDLAVFDDSSGDDTVLASPDISCMTGSGFLHTILDYSRAIFRSDAGGTDEIQYFPGDTSSLAIEPSNSSMYDPSATLNARNFEITTVHDKASESARLALLQGCLAFGELPLPGGSVRGSLLPANQVAHISSVEDSAMPGMTVFLDADFDGQLDPDEPTTISLPSGEFFFDDVKPGTYALVPLAAPGWEPIPDNFQPITILPGKAITDVSSSVRKTVHIHDGVLTVEGSAQDDHFEFGPHGELYRISLNSVDYIVDPAEVSSIVFIGNGGADQATLNGSASDDTITIRENTADFRLPDMRVTLTGITDLDVLGSDGYDLATLYDSAGDDQVVSDPNSLSLAGDNFHTQVSEFERVVVYSVYGGFDRAMLSGSSGNDELISTPDLVRLLGPSYYYLIRGFDYTTVDAGNGGNDVASLYDSPEDDNYTATPTSSIFSGSRFRNEAIGFDRVNAYATAGGSDFATLFDSNGNDQLISTPEYSRIVGPGFYNIAYGFDRVTSIAHNGGVDTAALYDSPADDELTTTPESARLSGAGFDSLAIGFNFIYAYASAGGFDRARLADSPANDELIATPAFSRLLGPGYYVYAASFDYVEVTSSPGAMDHASLYDSSLDDIFTSTPTEARFSGSGFDNRVTGFERVHAYATAGGIDQAIINDSPGDDELISTPTFSRLYGSNFYTLVQKFDRVKVISSQGDNDRAALYDSAGDDEFTAGPGNGKMKGNGFENEVIGFEAIYGFAYEGGIDRAILHDSAGNDSYISTPGLTRLFGPGFYTYAAAFEQTTAHASEGFDAAEIRNLEPHHLIDAAHQELDFNRDGTTHSVENFDIVYAHGTDGRKDSVSLDDIDFVFKMIGNWD